MSFYTTDSQQSVIEVYTPAMLEEASALGDTQVHDLEIAPFTLDYTADGGTILFLNCESMPIYYTDVPYAPCEDMNVALFDTRTWEIITQELNTGLGNNLSLYNFTISADSNWLVIAFCEHLRSDGWNCQENSYALEFWYLPGIQENSEPVMQLENLPEAFSQIGQIIPYADGSFLIAAYGFDPTITAYLPYTMFIELDADGEYRELTRIPVQGISISPDRSYLLSSKDGQITLWGVPVSVASSD